MWRWLITDFKVKAFNLHDFDQQAVRREEPLSRRLCPASRRFAVAISGILMLVCAGWAQDDKPKVPGLDKIISANEHLAFTGTVKSVDEKHNILSIDAVEGGDTEIFPIKHSTHVEPPTVSGKSWTCCPPEPASLCITINTPTAAP
jgi:hypothetical protein